MGGTLGEDGELTAGRAGAWRRRVQVGAGPREPFREPLGFTLKSLGTAEGFELDKNPFLSPREGERVEGGA